MIVVTGATGTIGSTLIRLLGTAGEPVRALSRGDSAHQERVPGVEWVRGDLADQDSVTAALEGSDVLFLLTGNVERMVPFQTDAIRAAKAAGVGRVVKLSALGATQRSKSVIGLWHYNVERELRDSGLAWTILRPHHFMQNFLDSSVYDRVHGIVYSSAGDGLIPFIDTRDIAAAAAAVLTQSGHEGEIYTLTGPEALSYRHATDAIASLTGRPVEYRLQTDDEAWTHRRAAGQPLWLAAAQLAIAEYQRAGGATEQTTDTVARLTGCPPRTFETFARDHADTLRPMTQPFDPSSHSGPHVT